MFVTTRPTSLVSSLKPLIFNSAKFNPSRTGLFRHLYASSTKVSSVPTPYTPPKAGVSPFSGRMGGTQSYTIFVQGPTLSTLIGESFNIGQNKMAPIDMLSTLPQIGVEVMRKHFSGDTVNLTLELMSLAQASVQQPSLDEEMAMVAQISRRLDTLSPDSYKNLIKALYVYTKLMALENNSPPLSSAQTPLRDAMTALLKNKTISEAIACMPKTITDVLTAHPVRPDQGEVVRASHAVTTAYQGWRNEIEAYGKSDISQQPAICEKANRLRDAVIENIVYLCTSDHIPTVRVLPEDEQRNISILVKNNEKQLLDALHRVRSVIRLTFFEQIAKEVSEKGPVEQHEMAEILRKPPEERLHELGNHALIRGHSDYEKVMQCVDQLRYVLERWYLDKDGNPNVNARTGGNAIAEGRRLALGDITEEHGLVKFTDSAVPTSALKMMKSRLNEVANHPQWGPYIEARLKLGWPIVKIYSGLVLFRTREAVKAAESFQYNSQASFDLLSVGIPGSQGFAKLIEPLVSSEKALGVYGFWCQQNELVQIRGVELGLAHIRNGETFFAKLLSETFTILGSSETQSFSDCDIPTQKAILRAFLVGPTPDLPLDFHLKLTEDRQKFYKNLKDEMRISPFFRLIASDGAGEHGDVELAILVMKSASKLIGHRGDVVVLCEDERAMSSAIALMKNPDLPDDLFEGVRMMCAGSDNQKKEGPLKSARLNTEFLEMAHKRGIPTFFGQGCSPHRSSTVFPVTDMVTMQPGVQGRVLGRGEGLSYIMGKFARQVSARDYVMNEDKASRDQQDMILNVMADEVHRALQDALQDYPKLRDALLNYRQTATTFFSRPTSKPGSGDVIKMTRAIESARFQVAENTCDPQIAGLVKGVLAGIEKLEKIHGVSLHQIHHTFTNTPEGKSNIDILCDFHSLIDPALPDTKGIQKTTHEDVAAMIFMLTGKPAPSRKTDPTLRLIRLVNGGAPPALKPDGVLLLGYRPV